MGSWKKVVVYRDEQFILYECMKLSIGMDIIFLEWILVFNNSSLGRRYETSNSFLRGQ